MAKNNAVKRVDVQMNKLHQMEKLGKKLATQEAEAVGIHEKALAAKRLDDKAREACEVTRAAIVLLCQKAAKDVDPLPLIDASEKKPWQGDGDPRSALTLRETLGVLPSNVEKLLEEHRVKTLGDLLRRKTQNSGALLIKGIGEAAESEIMKLLEAFIVKCGKS